MKPRRTRSRSSRAYQPEHGDWRMPVDNPAEAEHLPPPKKISLLRRARARLTYLESVPADAWRQGGSAEDDWQPISGWRAFIHRAVALLLLLPLSVVMVFALLVQLYHAAPTFGQFSFWFSEPIWYSCMGILLFLCLKFSAAANSALVYIYVVGHELTHALAAKLCFAHVGAMEFDISGGYVETDADNLFIALSPYFLPLWMCCWMLLLWVGNLVVPFESFPAWLYGGLGFWWCFHLYWTGWVIPREQPDMLEKGLELSLLITLLMNIVVLIGILCFFGVLDIGGYWADFRYCAHELWLLCCDVAAWLRRTVAAAVL